MGRHTTALIEHVRSLGRVLDRQALIPARDVFESEQAAAVRDLDRERRRRGWNLVDASVYSEANRAVTDSVMRIAARLGAELISSARSTMTEAARGLERFVSRVSNSSPSIDDARMQRVIDARRASVESMRRQTATHLAGALHDRIVDQLMVAAPAGWDARQLVDRFGAALDNEWWMVERVIRTETAFAYNAAQSDAIASLATDHRGMMKRWTELVDDTTGRPLDNKAAPDSLVMHGQLTAPAGIFVMPPDDRISAKVVGRSWSFPPNRPNDRAVVTPWMRGWGIPGWTWDGARRTSLR